MDLIYGRLFMAFERTASQWNEELLFQLILILENKLKRRQSCWECVCACVHICACEQMYLNVFVQGRVSIMGEINDAKEGDSTIDGGTKIDINNINQRK